MEHHPSYPKETERLLAVQELRLLDSAMDANFDCVTRVLKAATGIEIAAFTVLGGDRQFFKSALGIHRVEIPRELAICNHTILQHELITTIADIGSDTRFKDSPFAAGEDPIRFYAGIPVLGPNKLPVGTLCLMDRRSLVLSPEQAAQLRDLAAILENLLLLRLLSLNDHLTGVYNRRTFDEMFDREWRRAYRLVQPLTVLLIEPDYVTEFAGVYGPGKGDELVRRVANQIMSVLRRGGDLVARHGDEKFVVVLPETTLEQGDFLAENIRKAVHEAAIDHPGSPLRRVTVTIGGACVVTLNDFHSGSSALVARAEEALQRARADGGNRIVFDLPEPPAADA